MRRGAVLAAPHRPRGWRCGPTASCSTARCDARVVVGADGANGVGAPAGRRRRRQPDAAHGRRRPRLRRRAARRARAAHRHDRAGLAGVRLVVRGRRRHAPTSASACCCRACARRRAAAAPSCTGGCAELLPGRARPSGWSATTCRCRPSRPPLRPGRVLLAGDALSLINPLTGEGIFYALLSGRLAGAAAVGERRRRRGVRRGAARRARPAPAPHDPAGPAHAAAGRGRRRRRGRGPLARGRWTRSSSSGLGRGLITAGRSSAGWRASSPG